MRVIADHAPRPPSRCRQHSAAPKGAISPAQNHAPRNLSGTTHASIEDAFFTSDRVRRRTKREAYPELEASRELSKYGQAEEERFSSTLTIACKA